jgi:hypothetical protein
LQVGVNHRWHPWFAKKSAEEYFRALALIEDHLHLDTAFVGVQVRFGNRR